MQIKKQPRFQSHLLVGAWLTLFTLLAGACAGAPANTTSAGNAAVAAPTEAPTVASSEAVTATTQESTTAPSQPAPAADDEAAAGDAVQLRGPRVGADRIETPADRKKFAGNPQDNGQDQHVEGRDRDAERHPGIDLGEAVGSEPTTCRPWVYQRASA